MSKKLTPNVRFKGFSDDWEQRKLKKLFKRFIVPMRDKPKKFWGTIPWTKIDDIEGKFLSKSQHGLCVSNDTIDEMNLQVIPAGSLVLSVSATFGVSAITTQRLVTNQRFIGLVPNHQNQLDFLYISLHTQSFKRQMRLASAGSISFYITRKQVENFYMNIPNDAEKSQIGELFAFLDALIASNQKQLDQLKTLKKLFLQKIFDQEWRFKGFTDPWEQRKLGDIVPITMGQSPSSKNYTDNPNDYILVQGNADMKNGEVFPRVWTTQVTKKAQKGDLILSVRAPVGDIGKTEYNVVLGRGVAAIKGNNFIFQQLGKMKKDGFWFRYSTGSTFESINSNDIKQALILVPDEKEQVQVGSFLSQLDSTIASNQKQLDQLKQLKKWFLQNLFV